jgi:DNA-binding transcriptional ArsR family regulator
MAAPIHVIDDPARAAGMLHPLRLRILRELAEPDSAAGLARRIKLPRQQLNYHLRQLEADGLLEVVGERRRRNFTERLLRTVARSYVISPATLGALAADPAQIQDQLSSAYLVATAARTLADVAALQERATRAGKRLPTLTLHADIRFASAQRQQAFADELTRVVAHLVSKYHDDRAPGGRRFRFVAGAYPAPPDGGAQRSQDAAPRDKEAP